MTWIALLLAQLVFLPFILCAKISRSRKLLGCVLTLAIPFAGAVLALIVARARGGKHVPLGEHEPLMSVRERLAETRRLADLSASLERLMSSNTEERLAALVKLSMNADAGAVAQLRWAIEHGSREVVLDAALTLEELDLRREKRVTAALAALDKQPNFANALEAAEACAHGVLTGLADDATMPVLADQARNLFLHALLLDPSRAFEVEERLARLELAAARPSAALEILNRLAEQPQSSSKFTQRLRQLRDQAAFAARRFDLLSFQSLPLHSRTTLY
jgi:hypothetical protein